jgi:hypothetical protein
MSPDRPTNANTPISRRSALRAGAAASAAGVGMTVTAPGPVRAAQDATPAGMQSEHLEVVFTPANPVTITLAGGGPPQRGDYFYVDGPIYAVDDVNGTQIGMYHCFGAWTSSADDTEAPYQRLTTVQFLMDEGSIMGLINELGTEQTSAVGAVQGGTGRFTAALGTFQQLPTEDPAAGASPAPGTPGAGQNVVRAVFELMLPQGT